LLSDVVVSSGIAARSFGHYALKGVGADQEFFVRSARP
jgi:hypothetical protein